MPHPDLWKGGGGEAGGGGRGGPDEDLHSNPCLPKAVGNDAVWGDPEDNVFVLAEGEEEEEEKEKKEEKEERREGFDERGGGGARGEPEKNGKY